MKFKVVVKWSGEVIKVVELDVENRDVALDIVAEELDYDLEEV